MTEAGETMAERQAAYQVDLRQMVLRIWAGRSWIAGFAALGFAAAVLYLNVASYTYTARLMVTPVQQANNGSSRLGGLAGIASAVGVSIGEDPSATAFDLYAKGITSRTVAEELARKPEIMRTIFASEWDETTQSFKEPEPGTGSQIARSVKRILGLPVYQWRAPDAARLQDYLEDSVKAAKDPKTPIIVVLEYKHPDPRFAVRLLGELHKAQDEYMRRKALGRTGQYIAYLTAQLQQVTLAEHRLAIAQALSEQEKTKMMASSRLAYAAEPFGPVTASLYPTSPRPAIALVLFVVVSALLGIMFVLMRGGLGRPAAS